MAVEFGPTPLTERQILLVILRATGPPARPREQVADAVEPIHVLERAELRRQEQLCVPLVPKWTYWYLSATPELLALVSERVEVVLGDLP
jgi:hypothetical protein